MKMPQSPPFRRKETELTLHLSFAFGTRPELIKLAPLILLAQNDPALDVEVIFSAQHDELVRDSLAFFGISVNHRLEMMVPGQSLARMLSRGVQQIDAVLSDGRQRDAIFVQGDTTTVLASALSAFSHRIPVAHVEAGLRSFDLQQPFPERQPTADQPRDSLALRADCCIRR